MKKSLLAQPVPMKNITKQILLTQGHTLGLEQRIHLLQQLCQKYAVAIDWERILAKNYLCLIGKGSYVIDIGAHTGLHARNFIKAIGNRGKLLLFEPLPFAFKKLNEDFGRYKNVNLFNKALSNYVGTSEFIFAEGSPEESGLRQRIYNYPEQVKPKKIAVEVDRLDNYGKYLNKVDYIKIDVEGSELDIIEGGSQIIRRFRPMISIEYGYPSYSVFGKKLEDLYFVAKELGYIISDLFGYTADTVIQWRTMCDKVYWDYFLIPEEKLRWYKNKLDE